MYQPKSLLEAYYSIYDNSYKMTDEEIYSIVENYLLENYEFYSQEHFEDMIFSLTEEMIESIIIEGLKDMSPEDRERWIKSQPDPELARKKLQKFESKGDRKVEGKKKSRVELPTFKSRTSQESQEKKKEPEKDERSVRWAKFQSIVDSNK